MASNIVTKQKWPVSRIKRSVRSSDTVARLGGDEYAIVLENCNLEGAIKIGDAISDAIRQPITRQSLQVSVNGSIGVTNAHKDDSVDTIIKRADEAMYVAKTTFVEYSIK